jgi:hypothetical protein
MSKTTMDVKCELSEDFMIELRDCNLIHDWTDDGSVLPHYADNECDWTSLEDVLWYVLWLKKGADEKEKWHDDYSSE